jgi:hypothetical protein
MSRLAFALLLLNATLAQACGACTSKSLPSILVKVTDSSGAAVDDAVVRYVVNGGDPQDCVRAPGRGQFHCGSEEAGELLVTATWREMSQSHSRRVNADECHVVTEQIQITF